MLFVGRSLELRRLLDAVNSGTAATLVQGPVGVGKTRLVGVVAEELVQSGWSTEHTAAVSAGRKTPFGPFLHLLDVDDLPSQTPAEQLLRLSLKLRSRAAHHRLALVLDDVHLLDPESVLLIQHLVRHEPVALLLAARTPGPIHEDILSLVKEGLALELTLGPLGRGSCDELVRGLLGGAKADPDVLDEVWRVSAGNPLFIRELIEASVHRGAIVRGRSGTWNLDDSLGTSHLLNDVIAERLDRLDTEQRALLEELVVAGPLCLPLVEQLGRLEALACLEDSGLVRPKQQDSREVIEIAHPLYAEVTQQQVARASLQRARRRVAETLATSEAPEDLLVRARLHLDAGDSCPDLYLKAATLAEQRSDGHFALRCADAAMAAGADGEATRARARALGMVGRLEEAEASFVALAQRTGDPAAAAALARDHANHFIYRVGDPQRAETLLRGMIGRLPEDAAMPLRSHLALLLFYSGRPREALAAADPLLTDQTVPAIIAASVSSPLAMFGRPTAAVTLVERAFAELRTQEAEQTQAMSFEVLNYVWVRLLSLWQLGRAIEGDDPIKPLRGSTLEHVATSALIERAMMATQAFIRGHLADAVEGHLRLVDERGTSTLTVTTFITILLATIYALQGDVHAAGQQLRFVDDTPEPTRAGFRWWTERARTLALAAEGDTDGAVGRSLVLADQYAAEAFSATTSLHDVVRLGGAHIVADRLQTQAKREHATWWDNVCVDHAHALVRRDGDALMEVSQRFELGGLDRQACEAGAQAARVYSDAGRRVGEAQAAERVETLLERCGRLRTAALDRVRPALTPREHQVGALAAQGLSNAEIADRLGTSARTIGNQLQAVYSKLGVHSREELSDLVES